MKLIIAGTRHASLADTDAGFARMARCGKFDVAGITEIVSGGASGPDRHGETVIAPRIGIGTRLFLADWHRDGMSAGPIRNTEMAKYADALLAIWDGDSTGTKDMIKKAKSKGLVTFVWNYKTGEFFC